jgi:hypothetical protein
MIDTNKMRRLAQAALAGPDGISLNWIKLLQDFQQEASPAVVIELLDRMEKIEAALRDHHKNAMCEGCDHSHPLTQLRPSAYQQSKLYADTVSALEESK